MYGTVTADNRFRLNQPVYIDIHTGEVLLNPNRACITIGHTGEHLSIEQATEAGLIPKPPVEPPAENLAAEKPAPKKPPVEKPTAKKKSVAAKGKKPAANKGKK